VTEPKEDYRVRRILVSLDPASDALATLAAGARLAARLHAELEALFVEDIDLLHSAALPFVRRASPAAPGWRDFDTASMERELARLATQIRHALAAEAERARLKWSFRVVRGRPEAEALGAGETADLVIIAGSAAGAAGRLRSPSHVVATQATRPVLLMRTAEALERGVNVAYDGSASADRALGIAARLAEPGNLKVMVLAGTEESAREVEAKAKKRLVDLGAAAALVILLKPDIGRLCGAVQTAGGALVLNADSPLLTGEEAARRLDRAPCPVLLVR